MSAQTPLERTVLNIIQTGRDRCGSGYGKYPLGILEAVEQLLPLVADSESVHERLADFKARLER